MIEETLTGREFGPFQVGNRARSAALGDVYEAVRVDTGDTVHLWILSESSSDKEGFGERFRATMEAAAALDHPSILGIHEVGRLNGWLYASQQPTRGQLLAGQLDLLVMRASLAVRLELLAQVADALGYAHEQEVVHGAVAPTQVWLEPAVESGPLPVRAVLAHFGLGELLLAAGRLGNMTLAGQLPYLAPEQIRRRGYDRRADIYGLGMLLYRLSAGRLPFASGAPRAMARAYLTEPRPSPREYEPKLPLVLDVLVEKALVRDAAGRLADAALLARALRSLVQREAAPLAPEAGEKAERGAEGVPGGRAQVGERLAAESESRRILLTVAETMLEMAPGDPAILDTRLVNLGEEVDHFTLEVKGLPRSWIAMPKELVRLGPGEETTVSITLEPPAEGSSRAGEHTMQLIGRSTTDDQEAAELKATVVVSSFTAVSISLEPQAVNYGERCLVRIANRSNHPETFRVAWRAQKADVDFRGERDVTVDVEDEKTLSLEPAVVRPLVGFRRSLPFVVEVTTPEALRASAAGALIVPARFSPGRVFLALSLALLIVFLIAWAIFSGPLN